MQTDSSVLMNVSSGAVRGDRLIFSFKGFRGDRLSRTMLPSLNYWHQRGIVPLSDDSDLVPVDSSVVLITGQTLKSLVVQVILPCSYHNFILLITK